MAGTTTGKAVSSIRLETTVSFKNGDLLYADVGYGAVLALPVGGAHKRENDDHSADEPVAHSFRVLDAQARSSYPDKGTVAGEGQPLSVLL